MDELYGDLENYQYDEKISELKNENKELKCKLEEYASTLTQLQKDFDKLSEEYKKLEVNYSSLLKTARAEIERKSQMITSLNIEKDQLVLATLQQKGRKQNWKNFMGNKQKPAKQLATDRNLTKKDNDAAVSDTIDSNVSETIDHERNQKHNKAVLSLVPGSIDNPCTEQKSKKIDLNKDKEKSNNAAKKNKEYQLDAFNNDEITNTNGATVLPASGLKDNLIDKDNESKFLKLEGCKNREKYKIETKKNNEKHSELLNNDAVASPDETIMSLNPNFKDNPEVKECGSSFKKFDIYKEEKNKNVIKKDKEKHSDQFDNGAVSSPGQTILSLDPSLRCNFNVTESESVSKKTDVCRNRENKNEIKKSKDSSDVFSNIENASSVRKIRNRRKSMPLLNRGDFQISSDEDQDDVRKDPRFRRKSPVRRDRIHYNKYRDGKNDNERKVPDLIRMGDKHAGNYDSSRDIYRKTYSRYRESDRHKWRDNRDKHEPSLRSRRYASPDSGYNIQGEYHNRHRELYDRPHRFDNDRNRVLVSPASEKYQRHRSREHDGRGYQSEVVHPMKHKLHEMLEEPECKRFRSEFTNKPPDIHLLVHDRDVEGRGNSVPKPLEISCLSLQSPDYLENHAPTDDVTVIKTTSETLLDDPRLKSKKYVVNNHNNKVTLSTVVGRNIDIKAIDTTKWNTSKDKNVHEMPELLRERPQISEDLVKDIYMDIDNPISNFSLESGEICLEDEETGIVNENNSTVPVNIVQDSNDKGVHDNVETHDRNKNNTKEPCDMMDNEQQTPILIINKIKKSNTSKALEEDNPKCTGNKVKRDSYKQSHKKRNNKNKKDLEKKDPNDCNSLKFFSDTLDVCKNKKQKVNKKYTEKSSEKPMISARDTVEGDLELSDETCDYIEDSEQMKYDQENKVKVSESNKDIIIDGVNKESNIGAPEKPCTILKNRIDTAPEDKHFNIPQDDREGQPKESISTLCKEQKSKDIKSKLCDLFGDTSSLITLDDLGIVEPTAAKDNLGSYTPLYENTQDAVDLNVEDMAKVQTRSMKIHSDKDKAITKIDKTIASENSKIADNSSTERESHILKSVDKSSTMPHIFENVNAAPDDKTVVKTVIISTGIQNNCNSEGASRNEVQEIQVPTIQKKSNDNATKISPALLSIKALATSTPYKPQNEPSSVPEISCRSNNTTTPKDKDNISSNAENNSKVAASNLDIPDVRIIVKRRRKAKGAAP